MRAAWACPLASRARIGYCSDPAWNFGIPRTPWRVLRSAYAKPPILRRKIWSSTTSCSLPSRKTCWRRSAGWNCGKLDRSMATALQPDFETTLVSKLTRRLVPFLFLLYIVAYLDRINVGFAALQMQSQLHLNDEVYGLGAGLFFAGYFIFQVPSNLLLERVGARRWLAALMVAWGVISSSMIFIRTPHSFYALRFLLGAAEAGFFPGVILYLKNWFPARARARTVASFMTAAPLSGVVGGPISGALLGLHHAGLAGWQWMFLMEGVPAIFLGGVAGWYLTDRPEQARWLAEDERAWLLENLRSERQQTAAISSTNIWAAFCHWRIWLLAVVYFGLNTVSYGVSLWLPNLIRSLS